MLADQGSSQVEDSQHLPLEKTMQTESGQGSAALGSSGTSPTVSTLTAASQVSTSSSVAGGGGAKSAGAAVQQTAATSTSARFGNAKYSKSGTPGAEDRRGKSDSAMSSAFSASASSRSAHGEASGVAGSKATPSSFRSTLGSSLTSSSLKSLRSGPGSPMMGGTMGGLGQLARGTGSGSSPAFHGGFSKNVGSRHSTAAYGFSPSSSSSKQLSWRAPHSNSQHSAVLQHVWSSLSWFPQWIERSVKAITFLCPLRQRMRQRAHVRRVRFGCPTRPCELRDADHASERGAVERLRATSAILSPSCTNL